MSVLTKEIALPDVHIRADNRIARQASQLLGSVSNIYKGSVTAQATEIARKYQKGKAGKIPPSELGENFLSKGNESVVTSFMERAHGTHMKSVRTRLKEANGQEPTAEDVLKYMSANGLPTREVIEEKARVLIGDTFKLAQRLLIMSDADLEEILGEYETYHRPDLRKDPIFEDTYREVALEKVREEEKRQGIPSEEIVLKQDRTTTEEKPRRRRWLSRPTGRHVAGSPTPSLTEQPAKQN